MKPWENPQAHEAVFSVRKFVQLKDVENTPEGPGGLIKWHLSTSCQGTNKCHTSIALLGLSSLLSL